MRSELLDRVIFFADFSSPDCREAERMLLSLIPDRAVPVHLAAWERFPPGTPLPDLETPRTRKAHETARFARGAGLEAEMRAALYGAFLDQARDIGRIDVLVEIGAELGLDPTELKVTLDIDQFTDDVIREQTAGRRLGVVNAPSLVLIAGSAARILTGVGAPAELAEILHV